MPDHHARLRELFFAACDLPPDAQSALIERECADDPDLRRSLARLLHKDKASDGILSDDNIVRGIEVHIQLADDDDGEAPERISRYTIKHKLGAGGMGVVYLAEQENPRRDVAVKLIRSGFMGRDLQRRFELEAAVLGRLQHPGIAQIYEAGMFGEGDEARPFFAMEFVDGTPLHEFVRTRQLNTRQRLEMFMRICDAVHHAHQRGVIHRDLKPLNILVTPAAQPKILDFGVARATDGDLQLTTLETDAGQLIGTLPYMSPEQVASNTGEIDTRSDVYALGVILYELLADRLPYELKDQSIVSAARLIAEEEPAPLTTVSRTYRGDLNTIVLKALEKELARRYQSASDLAGDVRRYLGNEPIIARPATALYQLRKFARRNRGLVAGVVLTFVILVAGIAVTVNQAAQISRERDAFEAEAQYANAVADFYFDVISAADPFAGGAETTLRDALDRAAAKIDANPPGNPRVEYKIRNTVGSAYAGIGLNSEAERHLVIAVEKAREAFGPVAKDTAHAMMELGRAYVHQGRYEEAEQLFIDVLDIYEANPPEAIHRAVVYSSLATACEHTARYEDAERFARDAVAIYETIDTHEKEEVLIRQTLAGILYSLRRTDEAEDVIVDANQRARALSPESPGVVANGLNMLALVYIQSGRDEEALELHREVAAIQSQLLADDNPNLGISVLNLGMTLRGLEHFEEAEAEMRRAIDIFERGLSSEHPYTLHALAALANLLVTTERLEEAEPVLREVLETRTRVIGPDHPETVTSLFNLITWHRKRGEFDAAIALIRPCLDMHVEKFGREDWRTISIIHELARNLVDAGEYEEAAPLYREEYDYHLATHGANDSRTNNAREGLVTALRHLGREREADELASETPSE